MAFILYSERKYEVFKEKKYYKVIGKIGNTGRNGKYMVKWEVPQKIGNYK